MKRRKEIYMYKKRNKVKKAISFFLIIMLLVQVQEMPVSAGANKKIVKMLHGKWETDGMQGIANYDQWCVFTNKYQKWYVNGKLTMKNKIVKVEKKSKKKYVLKMRNGNTKFRYIAYVKGTKIYAMEYWYDWSGKRLYSGSGSLHRAVKK